MVTEAALEKTGGKTDDKAALITAMRAVSLTDSPRGPFHFDHFGNVVGNSLYPPAWRRKDGKLVQTHNQDLPERKPVLDLRREVVPGATSLLARLSAAEAEARNFPITASPSERRVDRSGRW